MVLFVFVDIGSNKVDLFDRIKSRNRNMLVAFHLSPLPQAFTTPVRSQSVPTGGEGHFPKVLVLAVKLTMKVLVVTSSVRTVPPPYQGRI